MADLAAAFHWSPGDMAGMTAAELGRWREKARRRLDPEPAGPRRPGR